MKKTSFLTLLAFFAIFYPSDNNQLSAGEIKTEIQTAVGQNSNPLRLNNNLSPNGSSYLYSKIYIKYKPIKNISVFLRQSSNQYDSINNGADSSNVKLGFKAYQRLTLFPRRTKHQLRVQVRKYDKNYIDRSTGKTATFNGEKIEDRFDYESVFLEQKNNIYLKNNVRLSLSFYHQNTRYPSPKPIGLSNLNNSDNGVKTRLRYRHNKQHSYTVSLDKYIKKYKDKRDRNLDTTTIDDSNLALNGQEFGIEYRFNPMRKWSYRVGVDFYLEDDNETGYYESNSKSSYTRFAYDFSKKSKLDLKLSHLDLNYKNREAELELSEHNITSEKIGNTVSIFHSYQLYSNKDVNINSELNARLYEAKSNIDKYSYDQSKLGAGIKITL